VIFTEKLKNLPPGLRTLGIFAAWIGGIILLGSLLWFLTQPVRQGMIIRSVNRILAAAGEPLRLEAALSPWGMPGRATQLGLWFSLTGSGERGLLFPVASDGAFASCLAVLSPEGRLRTLIPLSGHAQRIFPLIPPGVLGLYTRRIEASYAALWPEEPK
jgi:hypothetical protein